MWTFTSSTCVRRSCTRCRVPTRPPSKTRSPMRSRAVWKKRFPDWASCLKCCGKTAIPANSRRWREKSPTTCPSRWAARSERGFTQTRLLQGSLARFCFAPPLDAMQSLAQRHTSPCAAAKRLPVAGANGEVRFFVRAKRLAAARQLPPSPPYERLARSHRLIPHPAAARTSSRASP